MRINRGKQRLSCTFSTKTMPKLKVLLSLWSPLLFLPLVLTVSRYNTNAFFPNSSNFDKIHLFQAMRQWEGKFTGIACKANPKYFDNFTCEIKPVRGHFGILNLAIDFVKPLDYGVVSPKHPQDPL